MRGQHVVEPLGRKVAADRHIQLAVGQRAAGVDQRPVAVVDHQELVGLHDFPVAIVHQVGEHHADMLARFI
ncbi:hypothetical protein D3C85_1623440 [compost metagenome]